MRAFLRKAITAGVGIGAVVSATGFAAQAQAVPVRGSSVQHQAVSSAGLKIKAVPIAGTGIVGPNAATQYRAVLDPGGHKYCLSTSSGNIVVNTCSSSSNYQRWEIGEVDNYVLWINVGHAGYALTTAGSTSGSAMVLKAVHDGDRTQSFNYSLEQQTIYWTPNANLVLEAKDDTSGSRVYLIKKSGVGDQMFDTEVVN